MGRSVWLGFLLLAGLSSTGRSQVIEFESGGLKFQTLSKSGLTVMYAPLPAFVRNYAIIQVAISNGTKQPRIVRPEDFSFHRPDGIAMYATPAREVVYEMMEHGSRNDVIRLVSTYEAGLYGMQRLRSTSGYESRRQAALAEVSSTKLKAAAAASAIALVETKLAPGETTDGAVFFIAYGKPLMPGTIRFRAGGDVFEFPAEPQPQLRVREPEATPQP